MAKKNNLMLSETGCTAAYRHKRGIIKDNALQALLHDPLFRQRIEKKRKGKGSYQRKAKHAGKWLERPDYQIFAHRNLIIGFFIKPVCLMSAAG